MTRPSLIQSEAIEGRDTMVRVWHFAIIVTACRASSINQSIKMSFTALISKLGAGLLGNIIFPPPQR